MTAASSPISFFGGYRKLHSFGFVCLIYHATTRFCKKVYPWKDDPLGKTSGQMIGAARSARQNMVEASTRAGTSAETELRLLDVAKGSLEELLGDYESYLVDNDQPAWSISDPREAAVGALELDAFNCGEDVLFAFTTHIIAMRRRFAPWIENEDPFVAANAIIILIRRAEGLLFKQMGKLSETFQNEGGFRERMTRLRIEQRDALKKAAPDSPKCPACGKPMVKRTAKTGPNAGKKFWGCVDYPKCKAIVAAGEAGSSDLVTK